MVMRNARCGGCCSGIKGTRSALPHQEGPAPLAYSVRFLSHELWDASPPASTKAFVALQRAR